MFSITLALAIAATPAPPDAAVVKAALPDLNVETVELGAVDKLPVPAGWLVRIETRSLQEGLYAAVTTALLDRRLVVLDKVILSSGSGQPSGNDATFDPPIGKAPNLLFPVHADFRSEVKGSDLETVYLVVAGGKLSKALTVHERPSSGSGYPQRNEEVTQRVLTSNTNGYPDILELRQEDDCDSPEKCTSDSDRHFWRFNGRAYASTVSGDPLIKSATASSFLTEKKLPAHYYAAEQAIDGVAETAWVEGAKGPGVGESLTLELKASTALASIALLAGCGVTDATWAKNPRIKKLKLSLDGAPETELSLQDVHKEQTFRLNAKAPVKMIKLTIADVFKGKAFDDACISEVRLTPTASK